MVSLRSPRIGPRLFVLTTKVLIEGSYVSSTPEDGDAIGNKFACRPIAPANDANSPEKSDTKWPGWLFLMPGGASGETGASYRTLLKLGILWPPGALANPYSCGITQASLLL